MVDRCPSPGDQPMNWLVLGFGGKSQRRLGAIVVPLLLMTTVASSSLAEEVDRRTAEHRASLTVGLVRPLTVRVDAQIKFAPRVSAGIIVGDGLTNLMGAQGRYFLLGDFEHGMPLSLEILGANQGAFCPGQDARSPCQEFYPQNGLTSSALLGYKKIFRVGFTLDLNAGASFFVLSNSAEGWNVDRPTIAVNLGLGWSF